MVQRLKSLFLKYRQLITYVFFGGCTTLVNWGSYWVCAHPLGMSYTLSTVIAQVLSILFAYVTNRTWVFQSKAKGFGPVMKELLAFFASRGFTFVVDLLIMWIFAQKMSLNDMWVKLASNVVVVILNYILSKLLVFRHRE